MNTSLPLYEHAQYPIQENENGVACSKLFAHLMAAAAHWCLTTSICDWVNERPLQLFIYFNSCII